MWLDSITFDPAYRHEGDLVEASDSGARFLAAGDRVLSPYTDGFVIVQPSPV